MNWSYIAGLFDGEGSLSMTLIHKRTPFIWINISSNNIPLNDKVLSFFEKEGIIAHIISSNNSWGKSTRISISNWSGFEIFIKRISPYIEGKREQIIIAEKIINLHNEMKKERGAIKAHIADFDILRHSLHLLATKGNKTLKAW